MAMPYALLKCLRGEEPFLDKSGRLPQEQAMFLMQEPNMRGRYLGACLDSCRWGSSISVMYEMDVKGMLGFVQNWMQQNEGNVERLWHERQIGEMYTKFELPFIHHEACPRDEKHQGVVMDLGGRLRCSYKTEKKVRLNFVDHYDGFDDLSRMNRRHFYENEPMNHLPDDIHEFKQEEPSLSVVDVCYAIISERGIILPLETVIRRLNLRPEIQTIYCGKYGKAGPCKRVDELPREKRGWYNPQDLCPGHVEPVNKIEFPFDGWDLAFYVQKWHQQLDSGKAQFINPNKKL